EHTAVTGNNASLGVHEDRVVESEFSNRTGNLRNLSVRMRSRVASEWNQLFDWPMFNALGHCRRNHALPQTRRLGCTKSFGGCALHWPVEPIRYFYLYFECASMSRAPKHLCRQAFFLGSLAGLRAQGLTS